MQIESNGLFGFYRVPRLCWCMREDQQWFMSLMGQLPARLTVQEVAWVLNCQTHDVPILISTRLLKPLGNPPPNGIKFFATLEVLEQAKDRAWLARVTSTINLHWQRKNARSKSRMTILPSKSTDSSLWATS